jgi:hypothetical protein
MATSNEKSGKNGRLIEHPLVTALAPNPIAGPAESAVLHGYIGKSTKANNWRLYLDATLASYVEVSEDDILHHQEIADNGGTIVWVPKSIELTVTRVSSTTIQAEFLSGAIAAGRLRPTERAGVGTPAIGVASVGCPSIFTNCTSQILACPSDGCPTWEACPPRPTIIAWCRPSEFAPACGIGRF